MQVSANVSSSTVATNLQVDAVEDAEQQNRYEDYKVIRRNGAVVSFEPAKITVALTKAFIAVSGRGNLESQAICDETQAQFRRAGLTTFETMQMAAKVLYNMSSYNAFASREAEQQQTAAQ